MYVSIFLKIIGLKKITKVTSRESVCGGEAMEEHGLLICRSAMGVRLGMCRVFRLQFNIL